MFSMWALFTLFLIHLVEDTISLKFVLHPEANLNIVQKIKKQGYPVEIHKIVTQDNYILTTYRIPYGKNVTNKGAKRSPVLLAHGMSGHSDYFLSLGREHALPYYLVDRGFDVWLLNFRGTEHSRKHKYYDLDKDSRYWNFSLHALGVYDFPANVDYIVNKTNQKLFVIGHSQGNTCYFIMTSEKPEYNEKIKIGAVYGPSAMLRYIDYPIAVFLSYIVDTIEILINFFNIHKTPFYGFTSIMIKYICPERTYFMQFCINIVSMVGSHESHILNEETALQIFATPPARVSTMQVIHYMQFVKSGVFGQYNFGVEDNMRKYKSKFPPKYDMKKSVAPVAMFYGENDDFATEKGALDMMTILPNVIYDHKVQFKYFNHIDFLFGSNTSTLVYQPTSELFKDFDEGNLQLNISKMRKV